MQCVVKAYACVPTSVPFDVFYMMYFYMKYKKRLIISMHFGYFHRHELSVIYDT